VSFGLPPCCWKQRRLKKTKKKEEEEEKEYGSSNANGKLLADHQVLKLCCRS
jgi:hypothetical protein